MPPESSVVEPGGTVGILGAGQLGRMLALAAAEFGLRVHIFSPESGPAFDVAAASTVAPYEDEAALEAFARAVDVVTYEFENVPGRTAEILSRHAAVRPGARALAVTQDRLREKSFVADLGLPTAPFAAVDDLPGLRHALDAIGRPAVLKTRRFGYDGKGQALLRDETDPETAWQAVGAAPSILEGFVSFEREVSVVAARSASGGFAAYDLCANTHREHILHRTLVPAGVPARLEQRAVEMARRIAEALDYVGVLAVEMFLTAGNESELVVNEIAPRIHNSGHWTIEGARTSQFAQHIRAVCGWPLGMPERLGRIEMENLIGADIGAWRRILEEPGASLHLYGKRQARAGRKMGHVTRVFTEVGGTAS
jgi:5-(carboxyamino)imidazole ribonucleotide synthase